MTLNQSPGMVLAACFLQMGSISDSLSSRHCHQSCPCVLEARAGLRTDKHLICELGHVRKPILSDEFSPREEKREETREGLITMINPGFLATFMF